MCFKQNRRFKYTFFQHDFMNKSKTLTKHTRHVSWELKCRFDVRKCNWNQKRKNDKCSCKCKKYHVCKKDYIWNPAICNCENAKYLASVIGDSASTCHEILNTTKTVTANFD